MLTMKCNVCEVEKTTDEMIVCYGKNGKSYYGHRCKKCCAKSSLERNLKRKVPFSREWYHRKFDSLRTRAKVRDKQFELKFDDWLEIYKPDVCFYCNEVPELKSIDRVDNLKGYSIDNCVMCCYKCNELKASILLTEKERLLKILQKMP